MKIGNYNKATPIIDELSNLSVLSMPKVKVNERTKKINAIEDYNKNTGNTGVCFCFYRDDYGKYIPVLKNNSNDISLTEDEYIEIRNAINTIIENRIQIEFKALEKIK